MSNLQAPKTQHELVLRLMQGEVFQRSDTNHFIFYNPDNCFYSPFRIGDDYISLHSTEELSVSWNINIITNLIPLGRLLPNMLGSEVTATPNNHISKIGIIYESDEGDRILQTYKGELLVLKHKDDL